MSLSCSKKILAIVALLAFSWAFSGCATKDFMIKSMDPIMEDMNLAIHQNPDVDTVRDAIPAGLIQMDGFIVSAPNTKLLLRAAEANFGYAYAFVEDTDKPRASMLYLKARDYALRALVGGPSYQNLISKPTDQFSGALSEYGKGDVPALYWSASCWMAWAGLNIDKPEVLVDVPKIEAMLKRVVELDETYYYGSGHAVLASFYASRAKAIGGEPEKAKIHFERAFAISDSQLLSFYVLYAQYYAYQIQDRELFEKALQKVISTPVGAYPDKNFVNEAAKRKAKALLEKADEYF